MGIGHMGRICVNPMPPQPNRPKTYKRNRSGGISK